MKPGLGKGYENDVLVEFDIDGKLLLELLLSCHIWKLCLINTYKLIGRLEVVKMMKINKEY